MVNTSIAIFFICFIFSGCESCFLLQRQREWLSGLLGSGGGRSARALLAFLAALLRFGGRLGGFLSARGLFRSGFGSFVGAAAGGLSKRQAGRQHHGEYEYCDLLHLNLLVWKRCSLHVKLKHAAHALVSQDERTKASGCGCKLSAVQLYAATKK